MPELAGDEMKSKLSRPVQPRLLHERPFLVERASRAKLDDGASSGWNRDHLKRYRFRPQQKGVAGVVRRDQQPIRGTVADSVPGFVNVIRNVTGIPGSVVEGMISSATRRSCGSAPRQGTPNRTRRRVDAAMCCTLRLEHARAGAGTAPLRPAGRRHY